MDKDAIIDLHLADYEAKLEKRKDSFKRSDYVKHALALRTAAIERNYEKMLEAVRLQICHGLTQARAAAELGMSQPALSQMKTKWPFLEALCIEQIEDEIKAKMNADRIRSQSRLVGAAPAAVAYIEQAIDNEEIPHGIRYKASKDVIDMAGVSMKSSGSKGVLEQEHDSETSKQMTDVLEALKGKELIQVIEVEDEK